MTGATDRALRAFDEFIRDWVAPAAQPHLWDSDDNSGERVRQAIRAITEDHVKRDAFGYAVFAQRGDADADIGFRLARSAIPARRRSRWITAAATRPNPACATSSANFRT